jgi:hypothetical protein
MSSEQLADGVNPLDAELAATWDILKGYSGRDTDLGIGRRFGGAAAAYSLRDIGAMNGRVVKVRRDSGETTDPEEDFSANQVQDGTLEKWVNGELESTLPADVDAAAAAYSLRKVKASYSGNAVRIRRSSDDIEVDVAFDSDSKVSASSTITNVAEQGGESGSTTATDLNGFLNESTENFTATAYADIQASLKEWSSTPTISDTAFSGTNGAGGNSTIPYTLSSQLSISDYTGTKIKVTGTVNTLSGGRLFIKASELNTGGTQYTPPEGVKTIADGATGNFEYIFTSTGINEFQSVVFLTEASTIVDVSSIRIQIIEHGATVHTWYDQAGSNNAVQATAANQPKIASSGALLANGLFFDGGNSFLQTSTQVLTGTETGANSMYAVVNQIAGDAGYICGSAGSQSGSDFVGQSLYGNNVDSAFVLSNGNNINKPERDNITITQNSTVLVSANYSNNNTNTLNKNANNNGYTNGVSAYDFNAGTKFTIGARDGSTATAVMFNGSMQEIIAYDSDQTNNRFKIESNINNYYGLYNDANEMSEAFRATAGTLTNESKDGFDLAVGTPTAYVGFEFNEKIASGDSVFISFNLDLTGGSGGDATPIMRLTKTTLDGTDSSNFINPSDLSQGFNSFELTSSDNDAKFFAISEGDDNVNISISDFKISRIARNGFVETLYDQSGNGNDVDQTTAGSQPAIVQNGGQVKVGNEASIKFDGNNDFLDRSTYTQGDLAQPNTGFAVAKLRVFVNDNQKIFDGHANVKRNMIQLNTAGNGQFASYAGSVQATGEDADADQHLFESRFNGVASRFIIDGVIKNTNDQGAQSMQGINIGANHDSISNFWDGDIQEIIIYNSDLFDDRADLENDINNYYTIY